MALKLYEFGGIAATIGFIIIVILIIFYVIIQYVDFNISNSYKISSETNYIYKKVDQEWFIKKDGGRDVSCLREFVFFKAPQEDDCVDVLFGSLDLDPDALNYVTKDGDIRHFIHSRGDAVNVYWKPKVGEIEIGEPYTHQFSFAYPKGNDAFEKSITVASRVHVGRMTLAIKTENRIERFTVKKNSENTAFWDSKAIFDNNENSYPSFVKKADTNNIELEFIKLEPSDSYFVVIYLEQTD